MCLFVFHLYVFLYECALFLRNLMKHLLTLQYYSIFIGK